jgi:integrase
MGGRPNGASSIYLGADGNWHGRVTVGIKDDGKPDRRHVQAKTEAAVIRRVRALEKERDSGRVRKAGQRWTVEKWLTHWIENIAVPPAISGYTHDGYQVDIGHYLVPGIGAHRLDKLTAEHLERLYAKVLRQGKSAGTAHHVHRTIRAALNEAVRRGHLTVNPATLAKAPTPDEHEVEPYEVDEIKRILKVASERRNSTRWAIALALGLRQGEALGLRWVDVDLTGAVLRVRRSRLRPKYAHGCGEPCGRKPGYCPQRVQVNRDTKDTKSRAGKRAIGLPREIVALLREHKERQDAERVVAGDLWCDEGWVFAMPDGRALSPNTDYREWKALLKAAGVNDGRLHDARHTSATVLLLLGVPERTVMAIMGWSSTSMAARYQHVTDTIRRQVADRVDGLIWPADSDQHRGDIAGRTDHK